MSELSVTAIKADFRNFLYLVWKHLGLPDPTPAQYAMAYYMQHGVPDRYDPRVGRTDMVRAFRGIGKSYIAAAFCLWKLYCNPRDEKILVVSASGAKAKEFVSQAKTIMMTMPLLRGIRPTDEQRNSFDRFDVRGASIAQQPSLKAMGITSQLPGNRATLIVADDIEVVENSRTEVARDTIMRQVNEFEAIKVPANVLEDGTVTTAAADVLFLGTPQTEESIYNRLVRERQYLCFTWPARFPTLDKLENYELIIDETGEKVNILAPPILDVMNNEPERIGTPTDPKRFGEEDLISREAKGRSWFMLQYQLDTSLSDAERYPLRQRDLIVLPTNTYKAPLVVQWGLDTDKRNVRNDIANVGFSGDHFLGPLFLDKDYRPYEASVCFVDPSGRGADETGYAVVKALNGMFYVIESGGVRGGVDEGMEKVATVAKKHNVNLLAVEPNYAGSIWIAAFNPILARIWPPERGETVGGCTVEESEWTQVQKEVRIIDTLEPVLNSHRMVVSEEVARDHDLMYQLTHITRDRGCLKHDDRIDALAGAIHHLQRFLEQDTRHAAAEYREREVMDQLEDFMDTCRQGGTRRRSRRRDSNGTRTIIHSSH